MKDKGTLIKRALTLMVAAVSIAATAQSYDDFTKFSSQPTALDQETRDIFGRFFQTEILLGTGIFTGGLGAANAPGLHIGARFVIYFDEVWAMELGAAYDHHDSAYQTANTGDPAINYSFSTRLIEVPIGFRYGFDLDSLPRAFTTLNPYLAVNGEVIFRSETANDLASQTTSGFSKYPGAQKFQTNSQNNSTAFGLAFGGGVEFDVYKQNLYLSIDMRYHVIFWPDSSVVIGTADRSGGYFTLLGGFVINY